MRKNIHVGTKADVIKRRAKELGFNVVEVKSEEELELIPQPIINRSILINHQYKRIVTFNHPWVNQ